MNKKAQKILSATVRLMLSGGVKKTTMDEIAEAASASKVTVYKYFTDKDTLYLHTGRYLLADAAARLRSAVQGQGSLQQRLAAVLDAIVAYTDSGNFALCRELAACQPAMDKELAAYQQAYRDVLLTLIDEGVAAGIIQSGLDREMLFSYIDMGVQYYQHNEAYRLKMRGDQAFRDRYMLFFIGNIFLDGAALASGE